MTISKLQFDTPRVALIFVLLLAAGLRFYHLDYQSVWLDEINTLNEAAPSLSIAQMYDELLEADPHPPFYFILIHVIFKIFGYTTFVLRFTSAVIGLLGIIAVFFLGKELYSKKSGLYASLLLAINPFHLHFSQEGRMYSLLFLMTVLSFLFLVKFLKRPVIKSALAYCLFSTAMIYCHFFGLFTLVAQYCVLLFFLIKPHKISRAKLFGYLAGSGLLSIILYLPTYRIFIYSAQKTVFWIPAPGLDVYSQILLEFFGRAEIVVWLLLLPIALYLYCVIREKRDNKLPVNPEAEPITFSFVLFAIWLFVTLLIPLIRSYIGPPMLINRYFITILPVLLLAPAIGIAEFSNRVARGLLLVALVIFSMVDIFVVKKYYFKVSKTQFRELHHYISKNNPEKHPVISSLGWHFSFMFRADTPAVKITEKGFDKYVTELVNDSSNLNSFWYTDAHGRTFDLQPTSKAFLDRHFALAHSIDVYNGWAQHYVPIPTIAKPADITENDLANNVTGVSFRYYIDSFEHKSGILSISGWAFFGDQDATNTQIRLLLIKDRRALVIPSFPVNRNDVAEYLQVPRDLTNCGFRTNFSLLNIPSGTYEFGLQLKDDITAKKGLMLTGLKITI
jgi:mannosyltransferase